MAGKNDERRGAERIALPKPVPATFGGFEAKLVEVSLVGALIEHHDRIALKSKLPLRFKWHKEIVRIDGTVTRSEMRSAGGKPIYLSGVSFCDKPEESPGIIRQVVEFLTPKSAPPPEAPAEELPPAEEVEQVEVVEELEELSADFLQCTLSGTQWTKVYVSDPKQPAEGFTIPAPSNEAEADILCRTYERSDPAKRKTMRAQFAQTIAARFS